MARNNFSTFQYSGDVNNNSFTVEAGNTRVVDVDLKNLDNLQTLVEITFAGPASSLDLAVYYGFGNGDPNATGPIPVVIDGTSVAYFSDNGNSVSLADSQVNSTTSNMIRSCFVWNELLNSIPRWGRMRFTNNHGSLTATIKIYADA